jgi:hypothetical protein
MRFIWDKSVTLGVRKFNSALGLVINTDYELVYNAKDGVLARDCVIWDKNFGANFESCGGSGASNV